LAKLEHLPRDLLDRDIQGAVAYAFSLDPDRALVQAPPSLRRGDAKRIRQQRREMNGPIPGRPRDRRNIARWFVSDVDTIELLLGGASGLVTVKACHKRARQGSFGVARRLTGRRRRAQQQ